MIGSVQAFDNLGKENPGGLTAAAAGSKLFPLR